MYPRREVLLVLREELEAEEVLQQRWGCNNGNPGG